MDGVVKSLKEASTELFKSFSDNLMKINAAIIINSLAQTTLLL